MTTILIIIVACLLGEYIATAILMGERSNPCLKVIKEAIFSAVIIDSLNLKTFSLIIVAAALVEMLLDHHIEKIMGFIAKSLENLIMQAYYS